MRHVEPAVDERGADFDPQGVLLELQKGDLRTDSHRSNCQQNLRAYDHCIPLS
jgi:hypothetical protein